MGIYIKGMEMPKDCRECKMLTYYSTSGCSMCDITGNALARNFKPISFDGRPDWCPLVEIPEPYGEHLCEDEVVSCLEGADWINEVIRIFLDLQAEGSEDE